MSSRQNMYSVTVISPNNKNSQLFFGLLVRQIVVFNLKKIDLWQHLLGLPCKAPSTTVFKRQLHTRLQKGWRRRRMVRQIEIQGCWTIFGQIITNEARQGTGWRQRYTKAMKNGTKQRQFLWWYLRWSLFWQIIVGS